LYTPGLNARIINRLPDALAMLPNTTYESTKIEKLGLRGIQRRFLHFNTINRGAAGKKKIKKNIH